MSRKEVRVPCHFGYDFLLSCFPELLLFVARVRSSRYLGVRPDCSDVSVGWMVRQNRRGPSGSPCCGPSCDKIVWEPKYKKDGWKYYKKQKAYRSGSWLYTDNGMSDLWRLFKALAKSSLTIKWSGGSAWRERGAKWMAVSQPTVRAFPDYMKICTWNIFVCTMV